MRVALPLLAAFAAGLGGAAAFDALGAELAGETRLLLGGALGMLGALLAARWLRRN